MHFGDKYIDSSRASLVQNDDAIDVQHDGSINLVQDDGSTMSLEEYCPNFMGQRIRDRNKIQGRRV